MRRFLIVVVTVIGLMALPLQALAQSGVRVSGGGAGTFGADLDGDGDIDGSRFGMGVVISGGSVRGHFQCLMAGDSDFLGLHLMAVEGKVTSGSANLSVGMATFAGVATVNLANGTQSRGVPFAVSVVEGGPGAATLTLTVVGAFDGVPGDTVVGNGNYDLPTETVTRGRISIR
jgi:hypothetical protein